MIIQIFQSGGFAGDAEVALGQLDTSALQSAEQARVMRLTEILESPPEGTVPIGADLVEYRIEVAGNGGKKRTIVVPDDMDPHNPLLQSIRELIEIVARFS